MHDYLLLVLLITPSVLIARKSNMGDKGGFYIVYSWIVGALIYGYFGLFFFFIGVTYFMFIAFLYRKNLALSKWWTER